VDSVAYRAAYDDVTAACEDADGSLDAVGALAGWTTGLSAVGTVAGATALFTGLGKKSVDNAIKKQYENESKKVVPGILTTNPDGTTVVELTDATSAIPEVPTITMDNIADYNKIADATPVNIQLGAVWVLAKLGRIEQALSPSASGGGGGSPTGATGTAAASGPDTGLCAGLSDNKEKEACVIKSSTSNTLGTVRVAAATGATLTSLGSTITAGVAASKISDAIKKLDDCRDASDAFAKFNSAIQAKITEIQGKDITIPDSVLADATAKSEKSKAVGDACRGFDTGNLTTMKNLLTASAITSGVGTASGVVGTIASFKNRKAWEAPRNQDGTVDSVAAAGAAKEKKLDGNDIANIFNGVTAVTSLGTTIMSGITNFGEIKEKFESTKDNISACVKTLGD
jgi:hypothetical protein